MTMIACLGDLHLRESTPDARTDAFCDVQHDKVVWAVRKAVDEGCSHIILPGDCFDSSRASDRLKSLYIELFLWCQTMGLSVLCVYGQHDMRYRNVDNTPLQVLESAESVIVLSDNPVEIRGEQLVRIYGASWGEKVKKDVPVDSVNILVMHDMVLRSSNEKDKVWTGQPSSDYYTAAGLLRRYKNYDVFVTGDNHKRFLFSSKGRHVINCGSIMRMAIDQVDHKPCMALIDVQDSETIVTMIDIPVQDDVFDLERVETEKERNKELELFASRLADTADKSVSVATFDAVVNDILSEDESIDDVVRDIIERALSCDEE